MLEFGKSMTKLRGCDQYKRFQPYICNISKYRGKILNNFRIITITHKTANISHIGRYIPSVNAEPEKLAATLHQLKKELNIGELFYLATCNRLTFLFTCDATADEAFLSRFFQILEPKMPPHCIAGTLDVVSTISGLDCVKHIYEVASSLDSLVVGEREILRQLKDAYNFCHRHKLTGDNIRVIMKMAIPVAKEIYTDTKIGENSVSVVSLAMKKMFDLKPNPKAKCLIVGAGQTNSLVAKFLIKYQFNNCVVFNRSLKNAQILANKLGKNTPAYTLDALDSYQDKFDILITCTGANEHIINLETYQQLLNGDTDKKIIIDLAVPTDIHPQIIKNYPTAYIAVENLRILAAENLKLRQEEVVKAQAIIDRRVSEFKVLMRQRRVERAMSVIPSEIKAVKEKAVNSVFHKEIAELDDDAQATLERILTYIEKKYIGIPIKVAKNVLETELTN